MLALKTIERDKENLIEWELNSNDTSCGSMTTNLELGHLVWVDCEVSMHRCKASNLN